MFCDFGDDVLVVWCLVLRNFLMDVWGVVGWVVFVGLGFDRLVGVWGGDFVGGFG